MVTRGEAWRLAARQIGRQDARFLLEAACGCTQAGLVAGSERELSAEEFSRFDAWVVRRRAGEPLAYLLGSAFFCGLEFAVSPAVLIPRPETELLVDLASGLALRRAAPRIADLGTGSGIIAIMLARRCPQALVCATDISDAALEIARANAQRHGVSVRFSGGSWYAPFDGQPFDLIVANPPYVAWGDPHLQQNGLPFEPASALTDGMAGGDGTACLRTLIAGAPGHLAPGGWLLLEHGYDQAVKVRTLLSAAGFSDVASWRDGSGIERVTGGCLGRC